MTDTKEIQEPDKTMLEAIKYEKDMLLFSADKLRSRILGVNETNIFLEAFLLHARNLIDFLEASGQEDDILITDFKDKDGKRMSRLILNLSEDLKKKINKHCHHLSKQRLKRKFSWDVEKIRKEVSDKMQKFYSCI